MIERTNVVSLSRTRVDSNEDTMLETEGKCGGTVRELNCILLVSLEGVHQEVLSL
jgi:hypothetical protein